MGGIEHCCIIYVLPNAQVLEASLECSNDSIYSLMIKNILVLHLDGILCNMMHEGMCSYTHITASGDDDIDTLAILDQCGSIADLLTPLGHNPVLLGQEFSTYYYRCTDALRVLGPEYPLAVYMPLILRGVDPQVTIYVAISKGIVHVVRASDPFKG